MKSTKLCEMTQRYSPVFPALPPDKTPATSSTASLKEGYLSWHGLIVVVADHTALLLTYTSQGLAWGPTVRNFSLP